MLCWLLWANLLFIVSADPAADTPVAAESAPHEDLYEDHDLFDYAHYNNRNKYYEGSRKHSDIEPIGPNVLRVLNPQQVAFNPHNKHHRRIIENTYNPDYYQPTWILDYRYLKTGNRDYTRSDGGQILILPKDIQSNEHTRFHNYDELLEFLRLKQLAEANKHHRQGHRDRGYEGGYGRDDYDRKEPRGYRSRNRGHGY